MIVGDKRRQLEQLLIRQHLTLSGARPASSRLIKVRWTCWRSMRLQGSDMSGEWSSDRQRGWGANEADELQRIHRVCSLLAWQLTDRIQRLGSRSSWGDMTYVCGVCASVYKWVIRCLTQGHVNGCQPIYKRAVGPKVLWLQLLFVTAHVSQRGAAPICCSCLFRLKSIDPLPQPLHTLWSQFKCQSEIHWHRTKTIYLLVDSGKIFNISFDVFWSIYLLFKRITESYWKVNIVCVTVALIPESLWNAILLFYSL